MLPNWQCNHGGCDQDEVHDHTDCLESVDNSLQSSCEQSMAYDGNKEYTLMKCQCKLRLN
jgi:hypothetical protein